MKKKILFLGNFIHYPNREAVKILITKILPNVNKTDGFKLIIAGRNTNRIRKYANDYTEIYDDVKDIRNFYYESDFFVAPIFSGGGMRTKVLEAASCGLPVLMTPLANLGFNFGNKKEAFIANDENTFAHNINFILDPMNHSLLEEVSRNARKVVEDRFASGIIKERILREFREMSEYVIPERSYREVPACGSSRSSGKEGLI
jgi:Glycosyltransferase